MKWSPGERQQFLGTLDGVQNILIGVSRMLLGLLIAAVFVVVGVVIVKRPWGAGNQGEWFYFTVAVLMVLGWAVGQFIALGRRRSQRSASESESESPIAFHSSERDGAHTWELRFGSRSPGNGDGSTATAGNNEFVFSQAFEIPLGSIPSEMIPDEATTGHPADRS